MYFFSQAFVVSIVFFIDLVTILISLVEPFVGTNLILSGSCTFAKTILRKIRASEEKLYKP